MIYKYRTDDKGKPVEVCLSETSPTEGVFIGSFLCRFDCINFIEGKYTLFGDGCVDCRDLKNAVLSQNRKEKLKKIFS